jgi:hypothetical protein
MLLRGWPQDTGRVLGKSSMGTDLFLFDAGSDYDVWLCLRFASCLEQCGELSRLGFDPTEHLHRSGVAGRRPSGCWRRQQGR